LTISYSLLLTSFPTYSFLSFAGWFPFHFLPLGGAATFLPLQFSTAPICTEHISKLFFGDFFGFSDYFLACEKKNSPKWISHRGVDNGGIKVGGFGDLPVNF
jgi:hypothetical protein